MADQSSKAQCILLAVNYASETQLAPLQQLCALRIEALPTELILRILLTYLPTITPPSQYIPFVQSLAKDRSSLDAPNLALDTSAIADISPAAADKKLRKLTLLPLSAERYPADAPPDVLIRFICHRAERIDEETGLITVVSDLITPFLQDSDYLRQWYLSAVLPLLRLRHRYYTDLEVAEDLTIEQFEGLDGQRGTALLLSGAKATDHEIISDFDSTGTVGRDLRGLVGPWLYGHSARKRRRLNGHTTNNEAVSEASTTALDSEAPTQKLDVEHTWRTVFTWLVRRAVNDFAFTTSAIEHWDGPRDADLDGVADAADLMHPDEQDRLNRAYAQAALATCYAVEENTSDAIAGAHGILVRLATLLDFEPPPDLATSVEQLPVLDDELKDLHETDSLSLLMPENLLKTDHPLTAPVEESYMLLQMLVYSAYQLTSLGYRVSILNVTKVRFFATPEEQTKMLERILRGLSQNGKRDEHAWLSDRGRLMWLWNWNIDPDEPALRGTGPLGCIPRDALEKQIVTAMLGTGNYASVKTVYFSGSAGSHRLSLEDLEDTILAEATRCYDGASNGNRTRGGMKKASDIIAAFASLCPRSSAFQRFQSLLAATHSMSFYTLILQYGIPFQPINIRVSHDPLNLLEQILEQNSKSYTKLDDLIDMGCNLAVALPPTTDAHASQPGTAETSRLAFQAERRVILMCISAALTAQDFDTAYSYLMSRLSPTSSLPSPPGDPTSSSTSPTRANAKEEDDTSWRAALLAGKFRPTTPPATLDAQIRLLEQRTELLSLALRLAPLPALTEILNVYRRCEEEMSSLLSLRAEEETEHDDILSRQRGGRTGTGLSGGGEVPGGFGGLGVNDGRTYGQERREIGRWGAGFNASQETPRSGSPFGNALETKAREIGGTTGGGATRRLADEEAPVGLFDLAQGAAAALRRNAFPLRGGKGSSTPSVGAGSMGPREPAPKPPAAAKVSSPVMQSPRKTGAGDGGDGEEDDWGADWDTSAPASAVKPKPSADRDEEGDAWGWNEGNDAAEEDGWGGGSMMSSGSGEGRTSGERVRKRDVVANAVTGSLASGIGGNAAMQVLKHKGRG